MDTTIHWLRTAFDNIVGFLPNLVAGLVILLLGYIIAKVLERVARSIAGRAGFDRLVARLGLGEARASQGEGRSASHWLGRAVYYFVMIAAVMQAARAWTLEFIATGIARFIAYLPHVLAAAVVFGVALFVGNWVRDRLGRPRMRADGTVESGGLRLIPSAVRAVILAVGAFMALRELQIAPEIVNAAFIMTLGAIAVAGALAFGLGARDVAGRIAQSWYDKRGSLRRGGGGDVFEPPSPQPAE